MAQKLAYPENPGSKVIYQKIQDDTRTSDCNIAMICDEPQHGPINVNMIPIMRQPDHCQDADVDADDAHNHLAAGSLLGQGNRRLFHTYMRSLCCKYIKKYFETSLTRISLREETYAEIPLGG